VLIICIITVGMVAKTLISVALHKKA
jgi:hypothetical protein